MTVANRRVRVSRAPSTTASKKALQDIEACIDEYVKADMALIKAKALMDEKLKELESMMTANHLKKHMTAKGVAEYVAQRSNSSTYIDPKKFKELVTEEEFFSSVTVGVTAAKKVLAEKSLNKCSTVTPGVKKPDVLKVRPRTDKD